MSQIKTVELELAGQHVTDEELAIQLENCLRHRDPEMLNHIARSVVHSHFPLISSEPPQEKGPVLLTPFQGWLRSAGVLVTDFKARMENGVDVLRQWREVRRH